MIQTAANNSLVLTRFPSFGSFSSLLEQHNHRELYQQGIEGLIHWLLKQQSIQEVARKLTWIADTGYALRQMGAVAQVSKIFTQLPVFRSYARLGQYYQALCLGRGRQFTQARSLLEEAVEQFPHSYKAKGLLSLAGAYFDSGDIQSALPLYGEAYTAAAEASVFDRSTLIQAHRGVAVIKSIEGDHLGAVSHLETIFPLVRSIGSRHSQVGYDYLNSLAVEFAQVGRIEEASNICKILLTSPYLRAYPEWRETYEEVASRGYRTPRSFAAVSGLAAQNVSHLPISESEQNSALTQPNFEYSDESRRVLDYIDWKQKMGQKEVQEAAPDTRVEEVSNRAMVLEIVNLATTDGLPSQALAQMVEAIRETIKEYKKEDDTDD